MGQGYQDHVEALTGFTAHTPALSQGGDLASLCLGVLDCKMQDNGVSVTGSAGIGRVCAVHTPSLETSASRCVWNSVFLDIRNECQPPGRVWTSTYNEVLFIFLQGSVWKLILKGAKAIKRLLWTQEDLRDKENVKKLDCSNSYTTL